MNRPTINLSGFDSFTPADATRPGYFHVWKQDRCETCNSPVAAANSLTIAPEGGSDVLVEMGMIARPYPGDGYHDEETGMEVCDNCP